MQSEKHGTLVAGALNEAMLDACLGCIQQHDSTLALSGTGKWSALQILNIWGVYRCCCLCLAWGHGLWWSLAL